MKVRYDLHIHSGLSPCADKDMTPADIAAYCKLAGLDMIALADHNSIKNVAVALKAGDFYGITVVPATELQTSEDVHLLCLFKTFEELENFYAGLEFQQIENRADIFGEQNVYDDDGNVIDTEKNLLLASCLASSEEAYLRAWQCGGIAVPAHVDREANGMLCILGGVSDIFRTVELSTTADEKYYRDFADRLVITDSDAHCFSQISDGAVLELQENSAEALVERLRAQGNCGNRLNPFS